MPEPEQEDLTEQFHRREQQWLKLRLREKRLEAAYVDRLGELEDRLLSVLAELRAVERNPLANSPELGPMIVNPIRDRAKELRAKQEALFEEIAALRKRLEERRVDRRWVISIAIAVLSALFTGMRLACGHGPY